MIHDNFKACILYFKSLSNLTLTIKLIHALPYYWKPKSGFTLNRGINVKHASEITKTGFHIKIC